MTNRHRRMWGMCLVILAASCVVPVNAATPRLKLPSELWDFGEIWYGEKLQHEIVLKNDGDADLHVQRVQASCGCTVPAMPAKRILAPGESTSVMVNFDSTKKQGQVSTSVSIFTNDPDRPRVMFHLKGFVRRALDLDPIGGVVIRSTDPASAHAAKVRIVNKVDEPMKLEIKEIRTERFSVDLKEIDPGKTYEIVAVSKPPLERGRTVGELLLTTGLAREPEVSIPISATILDRVELTPPAILIQRDTMLEPSKRTIRVMYYGSKPDFKVLGVDSSDPKVTAQVGPPMTPGSEFSRLDPAPSLLVDLRVDIPPGPELPSGGVTLTVQTNEPDFEKIELIVTTSATDFQSRMYRSNK